MEESLESVASQSSWESEKNSSYHKIIGSLGRAGVCDAIKALFKKGEFMTPWPSTRCWLACLFQGKKQENPSFSLRAFARKVGISPARLSQFISGKRLLSQAALDKIFLSEKLTFAEMQLLQKLLAEEKKRQKSGVSNADFYRLGEDSFQAIAEWHHYAILNLIKLKHANLGSIDWISAKLGITKKQAIEARDRLLRLGLLQCSPHGRWRRLKKTLIADYGSKNLALQRSHSENIEKAKEALRKVDIKNRHFSSITFAANPKNISLVETEIQQFLMRISNRLEQSEGDLSDVFNLNVQLFPISELGDP